MKNIFYLLTIIFFTNCHNQTVDKQATDSENTEKTNIQYSEKELIAFLDSINSLPTVNLSAIISAFADSVFNSSIKMNSMVSPDNFNLLKQKIKNHKELDIQTAEQIFGKIDIDSSLLSKGKVPITLFSFDKNENDFNEFAICLDDLEMNWATDVYFFKKNEIIAKHHIYYRFGLTFEHFKDKDNKTVVYYKENFNEGTGIWQFNYFFYKYMDNQLKPVLNILSDGNLNSRGIRNFYIETFVVKEVPLTLKMVYNQEFPTNTEDGYITIINDSALVQYNWDNLSQKYVGDYEKSKISETQILTYYPVNNDFLFIKENYTLLKKNLNDKSKRGATLNYLNEVKNGLRNIYE